jgi:hypothetical protein
VRPTESVDLISVILNVRVSGLIGSLGRWVGADV